jgi:hypothetical protein
MARIYSIEDRREIGIAEDRRELLLRGHRISAELHAALQSGDGRAIYAALMADAWKPGAWFPVGIKVAFANARRKQTDATFAALARDARDIYVNSEVEEPSAARSAGA